MDGQVKDQGGETMRTTSLEAPRGLKGVIVTDTVLGDVRGAEGFYHYREFSAVNWPRPAASRTSGT
jgi:hypothetical protein